MMVRWAALANELAWLIIVYALSVASSLSVYYLGGLQRLLAFAVLFTAFKFSAVTLFPVSTRWATTLESGDLVPTLVIMSYFLPTLAVTLSYSLKPSIRKVIPYAVLGAALGVLVTGAWERGVSPINYLLTASTFSVFGGVGEELFFRGFMFDYISPRLGRVAALILQALAFGFSHSWNPGVVIGAFIFGLFLGVLRIYVGLEACIGVHFGINIFTQA